MNSERSALEEVYAANSAGELASAYAKWSSDYDRETIALGYCLPFVIAGWVARHVPTGDGPLLDAGCGTGLSGPYLRALGYEAIEGLDFSEEMLGIARQRNAYRVLKRATLGEALPWADGYFAAFLSTGVFTEGHAPASSPSIRDRSRRRRRSACPATGAFATSSCRRRSAPSCRRSATTSSRW